MSEFKFTNRLKTALLAGMGIGVLCLVLTWFGDDEHHSRFWSNFLHNSVFFTGIGVMAGFFIAICITAWAGWYTVFKRVWEAMSQFVIVGFVLMLIIGLGIYLNWHHLYHWAAEGITDPTSDSYDALIGGKAGFLNTKWYVIIGGIIVLVWFFFVRTLRSISIAEDSEGDQSFSHHRRLRIYAAAFLPIVGFTSAAMIWLWVMSIDSHWYSTMFAWYSAASWFVAMIALTILLLIYLKEQGYFPDVSKDHLHDLGKFLFAFSIFWTYLWFSQYMLIWYANIGEETIYFKHRIDHYPVLFYGNIVINFILPFLILLRNDTKRKYGTLIFVSIIVFFGHWVDYFLMIKPGVLETATHGHALHGIVSGFSFPGLLEIGTMIGFLSGFLFFTFSVLTKSALTPAKDPYLEESLHHHV
jgi:hypothetical protein